MQTYKLRIDFGASIRGRDSSAKINNIRALDQPTQLAAHHASGHNGETVPTSHMPIFAVRLLTRTSAAISCVDTESQ